MAPTLGQASCKASATPRPAILAAASETREWQHPPSFYCPISRQCMHDPVVLADGHTYERRHIKRWLERHNTSPVSGSLLPQKDVFPNHALRNAIEEYFQQVLSVHRRAIQQTLTRRRTLRANSGLLRTIDALMQCSHVVNSDLCTEGVLRHIMDEAKTLMGAEVASVFLVDRTCHELYSTVNSTEGELRIPVTKGIAGHVATMGEPLIIHDAYSDERFDKSVDVKTGFKTRDIICVPLKTKKAEVIGVVQLINKTSGGLFASDKEASAGTAGGEFGTDTEAATGGVFTADDLQFLQVFASQAAALIASAYDAAAGSPIAESSGEGFELLPSEPSREFLKDVCCVDDNSCDSDDSEEGEEAAQTMRPNRSRLAASCCLASTAATATDAVGFLSKACGTWHFDALELARLTDNRPLSTLAEHLFDCLGLVEKLRLDRVKLVRYFQEIERGYDDTVPYHNRAHAASVMHTMYVLLEQGKLVATAAEVFGGDGCGDNRRMLIQAACLLAAAAHDYEHLGFNNDFLSRSGHRRAMRYNDRHVNEQHHAAAALALLRQPQYNFLARLPPQDYRHFRSLAVDLILGTDMADHGRIMNSFVERTRQSPGVVQTQGACSCSGAAGEFVPATSGDAVLLLQVAMKCADLGHLALAWDSHVEWVRRLEEECFAQGDQEKKLSLKPVSFLMDRDRPGISANQAGFFEGVALPLFGALARAAPGTRPLEAAVQENHWRWQARAAAAGPTR